MIRALIAANRGDERPEARGFIYLMVGLLIVFVGQLPDLGGVGMNPLVLSENLAGEDGQPGSDGSLAGGFFGLLFLGPLLFYLLASLSHLIVRLFGGRGQGVDARLAMFWTILAVSPLFLLRGMASVSQAGSLVMVVNYAIAAGFLWIWLSGLIEAEFPAREKSE